MRRKTVPRNEIGLRTAYAQVSSWEHRSARGRICRIPEKEAVRVEIQIDR